MFVTSPFTLAISVAFFDVAVSRALSAPPTVVCFPPFARSYDGALIVPSALTPAPPPSAFKVAESWPTFVASVACVPAATFTTWRLIADLVTLPFASFTSDRPTDKVLARSATESMPSATADVCVAVAPLPIATLPGVARLSAPIAIESLPLPSAFKPTATAPLPLLNAPEPTATAFAYPLVWAPKPIAVDRSPDADAW
nr:hypothetical protein [Burkholderia multivorans]